MSSNKSKKFDRKHESSERNDISSESPNDHVSNMPGAGAATVNMDNSTTGDGKGKYLN